MLQTLKYRFVTIAQISVAALLMGTICYGLARQMSAGCCGAYWGERAVGYCHGYSQIMFSLNRIPPCFCGVLRECCGVYYENTEWASRCEAKEQCMCVVSVRLDRMIHKWLLTEPGE